MPPVTAADRWRPFVDSDGVPGDALGVRGVLIAIVVLCGCGEKKANNADDGPAKDTTPAQPAAPSYDATPDGLKKVFQDIKTAGAGNKVAERDVMLAALRLEDYEDWFKAQFGPVAGKRGAAEYKPFYDDMGLLAQVLAEVQTDDTTLEVTVVTHAEPDKGVGYQQKALGLMTNKVPLYSVRFVPKTGKPFHLWSFAHVKGTFRYLGKMKTVVTESPPQGGEDPDERVPVVPSPPSAPK